MTLAVFLLGVLAGGAATAVFLLRRGRAAARAAAARNEERLGDEIAAAAARTQLRDSILSALPDGVILFDARGEVTYLNAAAQRSLGGFPHRAETLSVPELRDAVLHAGDGSPATFDAETGSPARTLRVFVQPLESSGAVLAVLRDVTASVRVSRTRQDFVANASHELKTPAAVIHASAETVREAVRTDPAAAERFADQLVRESERLSRVVSDLLDLSRLESGTPPLRPVRFDEIVRGETERSRDEAAAKQIDLDVSTQPVDVLGSAEDLGLMVRNLVDNAVRYTPSGGSVQVGVASEDERAVLRVADTGVGIPTRDLDRIFERFYRVDRARSRETGGTGLGLSIVRHVVENHRGQVTVSSELGRGSVFEVTLPIARS